MLGPVVAHLDWAAGTVVLQSAEDFVGQDPS
jgi:hypothetical protein